YPIERWRRHPERGSSRSFGRLASAWLKYRDDPPDVSMIVPWIDMYFQGRAEITPSFPADPIAAISSHVSPGFIHRGEDERGGGDFCASQAPNHAGHRPPEDTGGGR